MTQKARTDYNQSMLDSLFLDGGNAAYLEQMQARYAENPNSVDPSFRAYFASLEEDRDVAIKNAQGPAWKRENWPPDANEELTRALTGNWGPNLEDNVTRKLGTRMGGASEADIRQATKDSLRALMLIRAYRMRGHLAANLDPLGLMEEKPHPELDPVTYGFTDADMDREIFIDGVLGLETASLNQILDIVRRTYCGTFAVQFMHVSDPAEKQWLQERIEGPGKEITFTPEGRKAILKKLIEAEEFEQLIHRRYPGTKRFGLDGGEALLPALEQIIKRGGALGLKDINFGMPHRGRLNVLAAVLEKPYPAILREFLDKDRSVEAGYGSGDVKYHLGASSDRSFDGNDVHLSLAPNPSHLEIINPVVIGKARAKQQMMADTHQSVDLSSVAAVLLHGDAAFAGQGVISECLAMSNLPNYRIGGTIHVVVNNQVGFTTSPHYSRSGNYCTDIALALESPVFHVNADDPEAVVYAARVATEYRQKFQKDVVIDMICYRRYGHNEGDDPSFTQPIMYKVIKSKPSVAKIYAERLIANQTVSQEDCDQMVAEFVAFLDEQFELATDYKTGEPDWLQKAWAGLTLPNEKGDKRRGDTDVELKTLIFIGDKITQIPNDANPHRTLKRLIGQRKERIESGENIDWGVAEHLAFGSLLLEGHPVRLSGQDCGRGTFSHRHSHIVNQESESRYTPLNNLSDTQEYYQVIDSLLSEEAVLGFEYGFSITAPEALTIWEAQFGDFANGAQVVFDQFISSAEQKWLRMSGLVVMLPHGYAGQGPEHSSARLERYLQLCAQDNMQVANCSTPANYFHILRRQVHRNFRKPLILMTPKSLLRHKLCVSSLEELGPGSSFHRVLRDDAEEKPKTSKIKLVPDRDMKRVLLCSGKIYYELYQERERLERNDVYLLRVEQFYPFPHDRMAEQLARFKKADIVWIQEEPKNMGAWSFIEEYLEKSQIEAGCKNTRPRLISRSASASTATGIASQHKIEQQALMDAAFAK